MPLREAILAVAAISLGAVAAAVLVIGGLLTWYIADAERRSTREFSRIYGPLPPLKPRQLDTDPDGPAGRPFRPIYRGSTPTTPHTATNSRPRKDR